MLKLLEVPLKFKFTLPEALTHPESNNVDVSYLTMIWSLFVRVLNVSGNTPELCPKLMF